MQDDELDLMGPEPVYRQLASVIIKRIKSGRYEPNRAIPSEHALCEEFGLSRTTVRAAIKVLSDEGWTRSVRGKGTFVAPEPPVEP